MHREDNRITLRERYGFGARLHARALLGENEFAAGEISGEGEQDRGSERKDEVAIEVLVQAVVVACAVGK